MFASSFKKSTTMIEEKYANTTIGEIVTKDFRAAEIFKNAGIDFCCGGNKSLSQACKDKGIDKAVIEKELISLEQIPAEGSQNFNEWDLGFLCDYIKNTHHKFVLRTLPELIYYTQKIASVHGDSHHELKEIELLFSRINEELREHLAKEEEVLFPAIKEVISNTGSGSKSMILSEISRMKDEHEAAGGAMDKINELSNQYKVPEDGCNTYQVTYKLLRKFEDDLHVHVHLENNILYPKALKLIN